MHICSYVNMNGCSYVLVVYWGNVSKALRFLDIELVKCVKCIVQL